MTEIEFFAAMLCKTRNIRNYVFHAGLTFVQFVKD